MVGLIIALVFLIIPFLIVGFWQSRPVASLIVATLVAYLIMILPGVIQTFQAMMIYGKGDPQLMAGGISEALVSSALVMVIIFPLLIIFQWVMRHFRKRKAKKEALRDFE